MSCRAAAPSSWTEAGGRIVYAHHAVTAADIPPIDDILAAVRAVAGGAGA